MTQPRYQVHFDFDCEDDPPSVLIWDDEDDVDVMEIFEEPVQLSKKWSQDASKWAPGPLATKVLALLNSEAS